MISMNSYILYIFEKTTEIRKNVLFSQKTSKKSNFMAVSSLKHI